MEFLKFNGTRESSDFGECFFFSKGYSFDCSCFCFFEIGIDGYWESS